MINKTKLSSKGWQFVFMTIVLSAIPYIFIVQSGSSDTSWTLMLMWMPTLAAILTRILHNEGILKGIGWNPIKDIKWVLLAATIPLIVEALSLLLTLWSGGADLRLDFITMKDGLISITGVSMLFGADPQPWYILLPNYLSSYYVGVILYSLLLALGEEYGWRGYLQKEWAPNNELHGLVTIGVIWGLWHLPSVLLGHNYPEYPLLGGLVLMPIMCTIFSIAFGVPTNHRNILWVAVIFHGSLNLSADVSNTALLESSINRPINDLIWAALWALVALWIWRTRRVSNTKKSSE